MDERGRIRVLSDENSGRHFGINKHGNVFCYEANNGQVVWAANLEERTYDHEIKFNPRELIDVLQDKESLYFVYRSLAFRLSKGDGSMKWSKSRSVPLLDAKPYLLEDKLVLVAVLDHNKKKGSNRIDYDKQTGNAL